MLKYCLSSSFNNDIYSPIHLSKRTCDNAALVKVTIHDKNERTKREFSNGLHSFSKISNGRLYTNPHDSIRLDLYIPETYESSSNIILL